jgi:ABC-type multidrug transport system fused ATPase/permease subunit
VQAAEIWMFNLVVDEVVVAGRPGALVPIAAAVLALTVASAALSFGEDYAWTWAGERFLLDLRTTFFSHLQKLSFDTLDRRRLGDLISRLSGDIQAIETFVLGGLGEAISAIARIAFFAGALFLLDWQLALFTLLLAPPFYLAARHFARLARHAAREKRRRSGALSAVAEESLANTALVQSMGRAEHERRRLLREGRRSRSSERSPESGATPARASPSVTTSGRSSKSSSPGTCPASARRSSPTSAASLTRRATTPVYAACGSRRSTCSPPRPRPSAARSSWTTAGASASSRFR